MSAGKVMMGTDGNPLLSADGKIVLADDLYPMVPNLSFRSFWRESTISGQWTADWESEDGEASIWSMYYTGDGADTARNMVYSFMIGSNSIDWARVAKMVFRIDAVGYNWWTSGLITKITNSKDNSTMPSGRAIRDDWNLVATYTDDVVSSLDVVWDISGVEPSSLEFAVSMEAEPETAPVWAEFFTFNWGWAPKPRIVYNLAT
jgi:hypothetical protein